jgi:hypothetical protein
MICKTFEEQLVLKDEVIKPFLSVLISLGQDDDALFYQAEIGNTVGPGAMIIYFHETSLILERVRTFGPISAQIELDNTKKFIGELMPCEKHVDLLPNRCPLILQLHSKLQPLPDSDERIFPMT